jgi:hypothetical protein
METLIQNNNPNIYLLDIDLLTVDTFENIKLSLYPIAAYLVKYENGEIEGSVPMIARDSFCTPNCYLYVDLTTGMTWDGSGESYINWISGVISTSNSFLSNMYDFLVFSDQDDEDELNKFDLDTFNSKLAVRVLKS